MNDQSSYRQGARGGLVYVLDCFSIHVVHTFLGSSYRLKATS